MEIDESVLEEEGWGECEPRRDCNVKRRDEILLKKNEHKVSAIDGKEGS